MIRLLFLFTAMSLCAVAQTNSPLPSIAAPREPLPPEEDSVHVDQFSFIVYGDTRGRRDGRELQQEHAVVVESMLDHIKGLSLTPFPVRFVLQTGDPVLNARDPKIWNQDFISLINRITTEARIPYFIAPGHHDLMPVREANNRANDSLTNYLQAVAQFIPPHGVHRKLDGFPTYAFGYGNSFFVAIDSNIASEKAQLDWVANLLENLDRKRYPNVFAFCHHPPYSSGPHGGATIEAPTASLRTYCMRIFRKHHVNALFTGREHFFEHWVERYVDGATDKHRLDVIVTGGGGAPLYAYRSQPNLTDYVNANKRENILIEHLVRPSTRPRQNPYHFVIVRVDGARVSFEVVGVASNADYKPYQTNKIDIEERIPLTPKDFSIQ